MAEATTTSRRAKPSAKGEDEEAQKRAQAAQALASEDDDEDEDEDDIDDDDDLVLGEEWEDAEEPTGDYPTAPRGEYVISLEEHNWNTAGDTAQNPGSKFSSLTFKIYQEDNEDKRAEGAPTVTIFHPLFWTTAAYGRAKKTCAQMGVELSAGDRPKDALDALADESPKFRAIITIKKRRREDPNTGKMRPVDENRILNILGRVED